jgi:AcrR family transcriptional regulator
LKLALPDDTSALAGVFAARQQRSRRIRDALVTAGVTLLNERSLAQLKVPDIAGQAGCSVGSFYTRFADKDAFFRALQYAYIHAAHTEIAERTQPHVLHGLSAAAVIEQFVTLMLDLFGGQSRGVLRETLLRIAEPENPWEPMREMGRQVRTELHRAMADRIPGPTLTARQHRLSFYFQTIVGVLHNDLINDHHVFKSRDQTLAPALVELGERYLKVRGPNHRSPGSLKARGSTQ